MKKVRIGLPDGNGCFGTLEFWKQYFSDIGVEYNMLYNYCFLHQYIYIHFQNLLLL